MPETTKSDNIVRFIEIAVLALMAIGSVFVFSAGANISSSYDLHSLRSLATIKQMLFFPLAVAVMYLFAAIDYRRFSFTTPGALRSLTPYLLVLSISLLILVLIPAIGTERNLARRWLDLAPGSLYISFQPSELAKWAIVFFLAAFLDKFNDSIKLYWKRFLPPCLVAAVITGLIITQDFGTGVFIIILTFLMLVTGGARWWHFLTPIPVVLPALFFSIITSPTRVNRLKAFFFPDLANTAVYQANQSLIAISSGRMLLKRM